MSAADNRRRYRAKVRTQLAPRTDGGLVANRLWPVCPAHGNVLLAVRGGWVLCEGRGWHARDPRERAA